MIQPVPFPVWVRRNFRGHAHRSLGALKPINVLAFEMLEGLTSDALKISYDADSSVVSVAVNFETQYVPDRVRRLELFYRAKDVGTFKAQTLMGVKFNVKAWSASSFGLAIGESLEAIKLTTELVNPTGIVVDVLGDRDHELILATLVVAQADWLVTGDAALLALADRYAIITQAAFVTRYLS